MKQSDRQKITRTADFRGLSRFWNDAEPLDSQNVSMKSR